MNVPPLPASIPLEARAAPCILVILLLLTQVSPATQWHQFGGPNRNFVVDSGQLATEWGETGPEVLWERPFGDGFSGILVDGGFLYSVYRRAQHDVVTAIRASDGVTAWESEILTPMKPDMLLDFGEGPIVTPVLSGDRLFTVSLTARLTCLDRVGGKVLWSRDLMEDLGASHMGRGYGPSPIAYGNFLIVNVGGPEHGVVAFEQETGQVAWSRPLSRASYSSPILVRFEGEDLLLVAMANFRAALNPGTGQVEWQQELPRSASSMMAMLNWGEDHLVFESSAYADGSRVWHLSRQENGLTAEEMWYNRKMRVMFAPFVRIGDYVYGSSGDFGPVFLTAICVKTGEIAWRQRGFNRTHFLAADGKVLLLDEEGDLAIATANPTHLEVHARSKVLERTAWTPPTLVGTKLYLRNRKQMKALELAAR